MKGITVNKTRIIEIRFDRHERLKSARIHTPAGQVRVQWMDVAGDWCWQSAGTMDARRLAVSAIQRIEERLHH